MSKSKSAKRKVSPSKAPEVVQEKTEAATSRGLEKEGEMVEQTEPRQLAIALCSKGSRGIAAGETTHLHQDKVLGVVIIRLGSK
jgi:hypothetical protein